MSTVFSFFSAIIEARIQNLYVLTFNPRWLEAFQNVQEKSYKIKENVKLSKKPENVKSSMTPTENTKWAEMPPNYKSTNVRTNVKC